MGDCEGESGAAMEHSGTGKGKASKHKDRDRGGTKGGGKRPDRAMEGEGNKRRKFDSMGNGNGDRGGESSGEEEPGVDGIGIGNKVVLTFVEGGGVGGMSPMKLTAAIHKEVGEVVGAKVVKGGDLVIECKDKEQRNRALEVKQVVRRKVGSSRVETQTGRGRGVPGVGESMIMGSVGMVSSQPAVTVRVHPYGNVIYDIYVPISPGTHSRN
ncbi:uncharacterized protein LOC117594423 [Esox lucius]|uniref:uncharacterized protein LOC117594423 n=1 Tax=Esox lucius TaxID=8010 RepID=UPI0014771E9D|nr:uncharacterized protein LOC117594423 [Esox lucius]